MALKKLRHLNLVLDKLNYSSSDNFHYYSDDKASSFDHLNENSRKILSLLSPDAVYFSDNKPFILFYSDENEVDFKSIWNFQIPLVFVVKVDTVHVYTGKSLSGKRDTLQLLTEEATETIDVFSYWQIHDEKFVNQYKSELQTNQLNQSLLENIEFLKKYLKNEHQIEFATRLVLRLIFIRFLIDRGVNLDYSGFSSDIGGSQSEFLNLVGDREKLYELFYHLKEKFSGSFLLLFTAILKRRQAF